MADKKQIFNGSEIVNQTEDQPERDPHDFYPTPWSVIEFAVQKVLSYAEPVGHIHVADLGAGSGRWGEVMRHYYPQSIMEGFEIQNINTDIMWPYDHWTQGDLIDKLNHVDLYNLVIGNPPFYIFDRTHVRKFIRNVHTSMSNYGWMVLFARGRFHESKVRYQEIFSWWKPMYEAVFVDRVSFYVEGHPRCGDTNATQHSLFFWQKGHNPEFTQKFWIANLPNDDHYKGRFKGHNTWQHMTRLGLVQEKAQTENE